MEDKIVLLKRNFHLFKSIPSSHYRDLASVVNWILYQQGDTLFQQGAPCLGLYLINEGRVKLAHRTNKGKKMTFAIVGPGNALGMQNLFTTENYISSAEAMGRVEVGFIEQKDLFEFLEKEPGVLFRFCSYLAREVLTFKLKLVETCFNGSKQRVSRLLAQTQDNQVDMNRTTLAQMTGVTYKTVIQVIKEMEERGFINIASRDIRINQKDKLEAIADLFPIQVERNKLL